MSAPRPSLQVGAKRIGLTIAAIATMGLSLALMISPALARHTEPDPAVTPTVVPGNPGCPDANTQIKFAADAGEIVVGHQKSATIGGVQARVEITDTDGFYVSFDIDNAVAAIIFVKGGDNANEYDYTGLAAGGIRHDDHLIAPLNGGQQEPTISHVTFCLLAAPAGGTPASTPLGTPQATPADDEHDASLNIRKQDAEGHRLPGAVFTIEGMEGTFTSDELGQVCIQGLPDDSVWLVTEIQAPAGYAIADPASQMVEVDNNGDCNSPDARFVNVPSTETPVPTPEGSVAGGTGTPAATPVTTPEQSVQGGTGTPAPSQPDTAMARATGSSPAATIAFALILLASSGTLAFANVRSGRGKR